MDNSENVFRKRSETGQSMINFIHLGIEKTVPEHFHLCSSQLSLVKRWIVMALLTTTHSRPQPWEDGRSFIESRLVIYGYE